MILIEDKTADPHDEISSDRSFGLVFAAFFLVLFFLPLLKNGNPRWGCLVPSAVFGGLAFLKAEWLHPLNVLWARFGLLLAKITTPVMLGFLFFAVVTPVAAVMRLFGKDVLRLKAQEGASYWIPREPPGPNPQTMIHQF